MMIRKRRKREKECDQRGKKSEGKGVKEGKKGQRIKKKTKKSDTDAYKQCEKIQSGLSDWSRNNTPVSSVIWRFNKLQLLFSHEFCGGGRVIQAMNLDSGHQ